ncbi:MAG TPA: hypothetical protein VFB20_13845 [Burkholderiales bacterium]|nr:hypothetical protein [Burkholderiales bacterium]
MKEILVFLALFHCHPELRIAHDTWTHFDRGVIYLSNDDPARLVHEAVHACQYARYGSAKSAEEWSRREREAHKVEIAWKMRDS